MKLCRDAITLGGLCPAAANGANEEAVRLFLEGKIPFLKIPELVSKAMHAQSKISSPNVEDILAADEAARELVKASI